jgi:hypothetical protein
MYGKVWRTVAVAGLGVILTGHSLLWTHDHHEMPEAPQIQSYVVAPSTTALSSSSSFGA